MPHHTHHKSRSNWKVIILLVIPISLIISITIIIIIREPDWPFLSILRQDETAPKELFKGSAVRSETPVRQKYEDEWRKDYFETWQKTYEKIMQNSDKNEIKELERDLKASEKDIY
ncbi:MAG TPA: hypothetical protein P5268_06915 [Candidatus Marinimicrobia bacterium]|nr:hypothetical protein [Candidatus Neomarinimicrobiota bacterium]HRS51475.1 hypothetical protein [Candidatus Neomarinimicrobiota bacterium]HRU92745.1 hypothetical protein [Candidatus Neomarinimicrobiota bacterium]